MDGRLCPPSLLSYKRVKDKNNGERRYFFCKFVNHIKKISKIIEECFGGLIAENKNDENNQNGLDNMSCIVIQIITQRNGCKHLQITGNIVGGLLLKNTYKI